MAFSPSRSFSMRVRGAVCAEAPGAAKAEHSTTSPSVAVNGFAFFITRPPSGLARSRRERVSAQRVRDVRDGLLRLDTVAGVVERGRDHRDPELARRHGDEAAADAALARQPGAVEPLAGVVVQARG